MGDGYPDDWDRRRRRVYKRDNYRCQRCGARGGSRGNAELHAHHQTPKSRGGSHRLSNLETLCRECHSREHGHPVGGKSQTSSSTTGSDSQNGSGLAFFGWWIFYSMVGVVGYYAIWGVLAFMGRGDAWLSADASGGLVISFIIAIIRVSKDGPLLISPDAWAKMGQKLGKPGIIILSAILLAMTVVGIFGFYLIERETTFSALGAVSLMLLFIPARIVVASDNY